MSFSASSTLVQRSRKALPWLLYLYALVLFGMHFIRIFDNSFWGDEGYTIRLAQMSFVKMCLATAGDVHPPLYYFFTQILYHILGNHGYTYHLSAVLPYGMILILACTVIRKWFGLIPAAVVVTFSSLSSAALRYNLEARMYSLAAFCVLVAYLAFYQIYESNRLTDWLIFGFFSLCAAYSHYYALISVAFFYLMLLSLWNKGAEFRKRIIWLYGGTILGYIVWLYVLLRTFKRSVSDWWLLVIASFSDCFDFLWGNRWLSIIAACILVIGACYLLGFLKFQNSHFSFQIHRPLSLSNEARLFLAGLVSILGTIGVGLILSHLLRPFMIPRYMFPLTAVAYLMLGLALSKFRWSKPLTVVLLAIVLVTQAPEYSFLIQREKTLDNGTTKCSDILSQTSDAILYTDDSSWSFSFAADEHFPSIPYVCTDDFLSNIDTSHNEIVLLLRHELTAEESAGLSALGYSGQEYFEGPAFFEGYGGKFWGDPYYTETFHLYVCQRTPEAAK